MFLIVEEIGLCLVTLVLDSHFVVEAGCLLFSRESPQIFLFSVDHNKNLPGVAILGDSSEFGTPKIVDVLTLEGFLVRFNDYLKRSLIVE